MFSPSNDQLARLILVDKEIGPRRSDIEPEPLEQLKFPYHNKAEESIKTILEYRNEIASRRCK